MTATADRLLTWDQFRAAMEPAGAPGLGPLDRPYLSGLAAGLAPWDEAAVRRALASDPTGRYATGLVDGQRIARELAAGEAR